MEKIEQTVEKCKQRLINYTNKIINQIDIEWNNPNEQLIPIEKKNEFNEIGLDKFKEKLKKELNQPENVSIEQQSNQFSGLAGLSFDREGNLYVADWENHRIQKFEIEWSGIN
jgi:hypothetical protein